MSKIEKTQANLEYNQVYSMMRMMSSKIHLSFESPSSCPKWDKSVSQRPAWRSSFH